MSEPSSGDLVVLVADVNMEFLFRGLLVREKSLRIRRINAAVFRHPRKDPGCLSFGYDFLRPYVNKFAHGLIVFDREGCGVETLSREELEDRVERLLVQSGWNDRAKAVVIDPELENWIWSKSPCVDRALGWSGRIPELRTWLVSEGLLAAGEAKPRRPKEALESALRLVREPRSSATYRAIAERATMRGCSDPAFLKLVSVLRGWFHSDQYTA